MSTLACRIRRTAAVAVALAAGSVLAPTATAAPAGHHHSGSTVTSAPLAAGLYQSSYSARNHVLWATTAVGRPPVTESALLKVDPESLKVKAAYQPPVTDEQTGAVEAVYGVAVDDEHNTVWTTNTRDNSVAVYSQRGGAHLKTLKNVAHAREIVVDERRNTAWASGFGDGSLVAFDTRTLKGRSGSPSRAPPPPGWPSTHGRAPSTQPTWKATGSSPSRRTRSSPSSCPSATARSPWRSPATDAPPTPRTRPRAPSRS